jgi:nitrogenase molybdenum-cofactor synthesis protein NifE
MPVGLGELYRRSGRGVDSSIDSALRDWSSSRLAGAASSLGLHPLANGLAGRMEKGLGIPSAFVPTSYGFDAIAGQYEKIAAAIGRTLDTAAFAAAAKTAAAPLIAMLKDKTLAVGCSINGSPWELASALVDFA